MAYLGPYATLAHAEPCHIQNPAITLSGYILEYSKLQHLHIENSAIFILAYLGPEAYSEPGQPSKMENFKKLVKCYIIILSECSILAV